MAITLVVGSVSLLLITYGAAGVRHIDSSIFILVVANTFIIAVIKIPTVYLRLRQRDYLISRLFFMLPVWPLAYHLDLLRQASDIQDWKFW